MIGEPQDPGARAYVPWVLVALSLGLHLWGLYTPSPPDAGALSFPGIDKLAHVVLFAVPTWALVKALPKACQNASWPLATRCLAISRPAQVTSYS